MLLQKGKIRILDQRQKCNDYHWNVMIAHVLDHQPSFQKKETIFTLPLFNMLIENMPFTMPSYIVRYISNSREDLQFYIPAVRPGFKLVSYIKINLFL